MSREGEIEECTELCYLKAIWRYIKKNGEIIMAELDDLKAAIQQVQDQATANNTAVVAEITRVEAVIAALGKPGISPADLVPLTAQLQSVVTNLQATTAAATAERP